MTSHPTTDKFGLLFLEAYESLGLLRPAVTVKADILGASKRLEKITRRMAQQHILGKPIDVGRRSLDDYVTLHLSDPPTAKYLESFGRDPVSDDEIHELASDRAKDFAHRDDQFILDALDRAEITSEVGAHNADVTFETFLEVTQTLIKNRAELERHRRCVVCPYLWCEKMQNETRMSLADDPQGQDASKSIISSVDGMRLVFLPDRPAAERFRIANGVGYAFTDESVVLGYGRPPNLDFGGIRSELPRLISMHMSAGAAVRREKSCVRLLGPKEPQEKGNSMKRHDRTFVPGESAKIWNSAISPELNDDC